MGDFNFDWNAPEYGRIVGPLSPKYGRLNRANGFVDAWVAAGNLEHEGATILEGRRIDYCFLSPALAARVRSCWVDHNASGSDHQPLPIVSSRNHLLPKYATLTQHSIQQGDAAVARDDIDATRVGVTGRSYAGYMTAWLASHFGDRFQAALGECAIYDWTSAVSTSDIGWQLTGMVGNDPKVWVERSPLSHVREINIPFMVMQYSRDLRIPPEQGHKFYAALRRSAITTELVEFDGGPHTFAEIGPLNDRIARLEIIVDWFSRWLR